MHRPDYSSRRNASPGSSNSSSSGGSSPDSSSRGAGSWSSEISPPSSASSTPPNAEPSKAAGPSTTSIQRGPQDGSSDSNQDQLKPHYHHPHHHHNGQQPTSPNRRHHERTGSSSSLSTVSAVPLFHTVSATSPRDIATIQAQIEAAFPSQQQRPAKSTNLKHPHSTKAGKNLRAHLAASSTAQDYYASEEDLTASAYRARSPASTSSRLSAASERGLSEAADQNELAWMNELISNGRREGALSGESLIDAVILHSHQWRQDTTSLPTIPSRMASSSSGVSPSSDFLGSDMPTPTAAHPYSFPSHSSPHPSPHHPRQQQIYSPRPSMPIATKQVPYQTLAAYQEMLSTAAPGYPCAPVP